MSKLHSTLTLRHATYWNPTTGEQLNTQETEHHLARDIQHITNLAEYHLLAAPTLRQELDTYLNNPDNPTQPRAIARTLNITWDNTYLPRATGASRQGIIAQNRIINELLSYNERYKAWAGTNSKNISQGWTRTANPTPPTYLTPRAELSSADKQYCYWANNPLTNTDKHAHLMLVINYTWVLVLIPLPTKRIRKDAIKICLPNLRIATDGSILYDTTIEYAYNYTHFNPTHASTVDVGITEYATLSYVETATGNIEETTTLSTRVRRMVLSIRASEEQKKNLRRKGDVCQRGGDYVTAHSYYEEARFHREAASRKKRELAIVAAQEIAAFAAERGNSVVIFEDLGWVENTMQNGRWNRGELLRWTRYYVELNGGRVFTVSAWRTSQDCHLCGEQVVFLEDRQVRCDACGMVADRDVNATGNIGRRAHRLLLKSQKTRLEGKYSTAVQVRRSPVTRVSLKYPGRDRSKSEPTPKKPKKRKGVSARGEVYSRMVNGSPTLAVSSSSRATVVGDTRESKSQSGTARQLEPYCYDLDRVYHLDPIYRT